MKITTNRTINRFRQFALINLVLIIGLSMKVFSQTTYFVDANGTSTNQNGLSWTDAYTNLDSALIHAQAGDTIKVASGTYFPETARECSNCPGPPSPNNNRYNYFFIDTSIVLLGSFDPGTNSQNYSVPSILSGNIGSPTDSTDNSLQVLIMVNAGTPRIDGFTISDGHATPPSITNTTIDNVALPRERGAACLYNNTTPSFSNMIFENHYGGSASIFAWTDGIFEDCIFQNNRTQNKAAAIELFAGHLECHLVDFINNATNASAIYNGGAIQIRAAGTASFTDCNFTDNYSGKNGGALHSYGSLELTSCHFENNSCDEEGGALYTEGLDSLILMDCQFLKNSADGNGGGIMNRDLGVGKYINIVAAENTSGDDCGGLYELNSNDVTISNGLFVQNTAGDFGGGMICENATVDIINSTFYDNEAGSSNQGDGLSNVGTSNTSIYNSIFDGHANDLHEPTLLNTYYTFVYRHLYINDSTRIAGLLPLFIEPSDPRGMDQIWATSDDGLRLSPCSPLINEGVDSFSIFDFDFIMNDRIQHGMIDVGAYESAPLMNSVPRLYVDKDVIGGGDGLSWTTAFNNFSHVNYCPVDSFEEIWVAEGIYDRAVIPNGVKVYGGFNGMEDSLHQRDWQTHPTNLAPRFINNQDTTTFDGFTVKYVNSYTLGNAVISYNSIVRISNCEIANNEQLIYHGHNIIDREETAGIEIKADSVHSYTEINSGMRIFSLPREAFIKGKKSFAKRR